MEQINVTVREAARQRKPLDGSDAQVLEGALRQVETELVGVKSIAQNLRTLLAVKTMECKAAMEMLHESRDPAGWQTFVDKLARMVGCLPCITPEGNRHILEKIEKLVKGTNESKNKVEEEVAGQGEEGTAVQGGNGPEVHNDG